MSSKGLKWAAPYVHRGKDEEKSLWAPTVVLGAPKPLPMTAPNGHLTMAQFTMAPIMAPPKMAPIMAPVMAPVMAPISMAPAAARKRQQNTFINMAEQVTEQKKRKLPDQIRNTKAKHTMLNSVQTDHGTVLVVDDASALTQRTIPAQQPAHQPAPTERSPPEVGRTPAFAEYLRTLPPCPPTPEKNENTMMGVPTSDGPRSLSTGEQAALTLLTLPSCMTLHPSGCHGG